MNEIDEILKNIPPEEFQFVSVESSGIFVPQDVRCELWKKCIFQQSSFADVCDELDNSWEKLLAAGFNSNFLTRCRWLDIYVLSQKLRVTLEKITCDLQVSQTQKDSWKLTTEEKRLLNGDGF